MRYLISLILVFTMTACSKTSYEGVATDHQSATTARSASTQGDADNTDIQVMMLGTYHFKASNSDVVSLETASVLTPDKQIELEAVARTLAAFKPTAIITERVTQPPEYIDPVFETFDQKMLSENSNERVQIAYRLARQAGVSRVYGIDEQPDDTEPDYFPFSELMDHAKATGQGDVFDKLIADMRTKAESEMKSTEHLPINERLISVNNGFLSSPEFYYQLSQFDQAETQPAAELQAYWFMRNAKIFSKLMDVTQPGDRIVIVYGAGHKYWLEHFIENTPGFHKVDPIPYLQ